MKKIVLSVALFSVLAVFTGYAVAVAFNFNLNSNNLSVDVCTKTDIGTNSLTVSEPIVTEPIVTEPIVTEPIVTEPIVTEPIVTEPIATEPIATEPIATESVDESNEGFFDKVFDFVFLWVALVLFVLLCFSPVIQFFLDDF